jgi:hypothetical protein
MFPFGNEFLRSIKEQNKEFCMKNLYKLVGVIALVAIIGFSMAACDTGGGGSSGTGGGSNLSGIYINIGSSSVPDALEFTSASAVTYHRYTMSPNNSYSGTYTVSGNTVTCTFSYSGQAVIFSYTLSSDKTRLTVASSSGPISANVGVTLDKKTKRNAADFAGTWKLGGDLSVTFNGSNFTYTNAGDSSQNVNGTFTAYEDAITFKIANQNYTWISGVYTMTATVLTISKSTGNLINGTYTKQ